LGAGGFAKRFGCTRPPFHKRRKSWARAQRRFAPGPTGIRHYTPRNESAPSVTTP
jgi:hypothetical protein